jgi:hypothetical protein
MLPTRPEVHVCAIAVGSAFVVEMAALAAADDDDRIRPLAGVPP